MREVRDITRTSTLVSSSCIRCIYMLSPFRQVSLIGFLALQNRACSVFAAPFAAFLPHNMLKGSRMESRKSGFHMKQDLEV